MKRLLAIIVASLATAAAAWAQPDAIPGVDHGRGHSGDGPAPRALYTQTNAADGNAVLVFHRNRGALDLAATVRTHGLGTGVGLGSQSSVALSRDGRLLFVVNAGSDSISAFLIGPRGPVLVDRVRSGGDQPISLALHDNLLYVLNAGTTANVTGFRIGFAGRLQPVRGSTRPLSGAAVQPAQVQFNNTGDFLAVTEKASNRIDLYVVNDGLANGPVAHAAHGTTPFGFAFDKRDRLIVSEAFADAPGASAVSSYDFDSTNSPFDAISGSVRSGQTSAWGVVTTRDGHYAFVANTGSATLSGYRITRDGKLSLLTGNGISASTAAGSMPQDLALTEQGGFLFALTPGTGTVDSFSVGQDGSLKHVANTGGIPASAQGLAVH